MEGKIQLILIPYDSYLKITINSHNLVYCLFYCLFHHEFQKLKSLSFDDNLEEIRKLFIVENNDIFHKDTYPNMLGIEMAMNIIMSQIIITPSLIKELQERTSKMQEERINRKNKEVTNIIPNLYLLALLTSLRNKLFAIYENKLYVKKCN